MTNKEFNALLRDARYQMEPSEEVQIERMLSQLPKIRRRTLKEKMLLATTAAAALVLFIAFAAPPIVKAVGALVDRVFGERLTQIEQYEKLPEEEKLQQMADEIAMYMRGHDLEGATAEFEGVTIELSEFVLLPADAYDPSRKDGLLRANLTYSQVPSFDPNYIDFAVEYGGKTYPMELGDGDNAYRSTGKVASTEADWWSDEFSLYSNSQIADGVPTTCIFFPVDHWYLEEPTDMVLKGTLDGKSFSIPFTFDPAKAEAQNLADAEESMKATEEMNREAKEKIERYAAEAVELNLDRSAQGVDFKISEMSVIGSKVYLTASFANVAENNPKIAGHSFWLNDFCVDGHMGRTLGSDNDLLENGVYSAIYESMLSYDMANLPEESLITLSVDLGDYENRVPVAFRYNWKTKAVTVPKDADEEAQWIAESQAMTTSLEKAFPVIQSYDLSALNLKETINGITVALKRAEMNNNQFEVEFDFDYAELGSGTRAILDGASKIGGYDAEHGGSSWTSGDIPTGVSFMLPIHYSEFGDNTKVEFVLPVRIIDAKGEEILSATFNFEFTLDRESMNPELVYAADLEEYYGKK